MTPQVLLLHANAVGAGNWDRLFTWLEQSGHRFAAADEVLADPAFADLPRLPATHGFSLWDRLGAVRRDGEAREAVRGAPRRPGRGVEPRRHRGLLLRLRGGRRVRVAHRPHQRAPQVVERYRRRYPGREAMGALALDVARDAHGVGHRGLALGDAVPSRVHSVSVVARWTLRRAGQPDATGLTLVVLRPRRDGWEIVQDASM